MENAEEALGEGAAVLVYPGGDHEVYRPWWRRHEIDFDGRCGFVRLALRTGVPVVPVVANGGHDSIFVVVRGDRLARAMRLDRLRMSIFPFTLQFPLGLAPAWLPHVPLPAKVDIELCEPFDWSELGPEGADDPEVVQACYDEITGRMQETLSRLGREHPLPVLERLARATRLDR
jgi:1-acyl-sn-glycerol-3-phosphate acyltransferase